MATGFNTQVSNGEYRLQFETDNREYYLLMQSTARRCVDGAHMTNADKIRAMSDEELANLLTDFSNNGGWITEIGREICYKRITDWLKQPSEEGE